MVSFRARGMRRRGRALPSTRPWPSALPAALLTVRDSKARLTLWDNLGRVPLGLFPSCPPCLGHPGQVLLIRPLSWEAASGAPMQLSFSELGGSEGPVEAILYPSASRSTAHRPAHRGPNPHTSALVFSFGP